MATTKTVYQTGAEGLYIGPAVAHESPREPGVYLVPAGCVEAVPPALESHEAAVWRGDAWIVVPDHRGETWYIGRDPVVVEAVGDPVDQGLTPDRPAPGLDELREAKIAEISAYATGLLLAGAPVSAGLHVALDDGSRADLTAMAATATAAASGAVEWPESYARGWISIENIRIPIAAPADGLALAAIVGGFYASLVQHRRDLKDAAIAAENAAEMNAIDVTAGWPAEVGG